MTNFDDITAARKQYLADHPFDPHANALPSVDGDGMPAGFMLLPNMDELQILAVKLGIEYVAICNDDEAVEEWIQTCIGLARSPELNGLLLANVFRGMNQYLATIVEHAVEPGGLRATAVQVWKKGITDVKGGAE